MPNTETIMGLPIEANHKKTSPLLLRFFGLANKALEHAGRIIAAALALVDNNDAGQIAIAEMEVGIALCERFAGEASPLVRREPRQPRPNDTVAAS